MSGKQFAWHLAKQALLEVRDGCCTAGAVLFVMALIDLVRS